MANKKKAHILQNECDLDQSSRRNRKQYLLQFSQTKRCCFSLDIIQ